MPFKKLTRWLREDSARKAPRSLQVIPLEDRVTPSASLVDINSSFLGAGNRPSNIINMSDDGRYVLFESKASDLIVGQQDIPDTNDLFWRDLQTGETRMITALPTATTNGYDYAGTLLSPVSFSLQSVVDGAPVKPSFNKAVISGDGRYVAFSSVINAARLDQDFANQTYLPSSPSTTVTDLDNTLDVFRWEAKSGLLELASRTVANPDTNNKLVSFGRFGSSDTPAISDDGLIVEFLSRVDAWYTSRLGKPTAFAEDIVVDAGNTQDVFATSFDRNGGTAITPISAATAQDTVLGSSTRFVRTYGHAAGGEGVQVDASGRYVAVDLGGNVSAAFTAPVDPSKSLNLGFSSIFFFSLTNTVGNVRTTSGNAEAWRTDINAGFVGDINDILITATDGKINSISGITAGGGNAQNVIVARKTPSALLVSTSSGGSVTGNFNPSPQAPNPLRQDLFFVRTDLNSQTAKVLNTTRLPSTAASTSVADTTQYSISPNGKFSVYTQVEGVRADGADKTQVYFRQTLPTVSTAQLVSVGLNGLPLTNGANFPRVSRNGRFVSFTSDTLANQVVSVSITDTNNANDVFLRDLWASLNSKGVAVPATQLLSANSLGTGTSNGASSRGFVGTTNEDPLNGISPSSPNDAVGRAIFVSTASNIDLGFIPTHGGTSIYTQPLPIGGLPPTVPPTDAPRTGVASGGRDAGITALSFSGAGTIVLGQRLTPFPGYTGELRVASADFNGDGVLDTAVAPGRGVGPRVIVYNGLNDSRLFDFFAYEPTFTGGVNLAAADISGDGKAEIILGADAGGGARVRVLNLNAGKTLVDFFAYNPEFRGGVRVATGDFNGDGTIDVLTGDRSGGGPRVSAFSGVGINSGILNRFIDFFAMELNLRNGVFVAGGDMNNDGVDDIVVGAGSGGGPRVAVFEATSVISRPTAPDMLYNFFAGNVASRAGIRVAVKNVDGDNVADIVTGEGFGRESRVRSFSGAKFSAPLTPTEIANTFVVFDDLTSLNGAWVG